VTGVAIGSATITGTSEGKTGTADVTVTAVPVATVEITPSSSDLTLGQTRQLSAIAKDARGTVLTGRAAAWSSGAPSVVTISSTGVVTAVGAGSAIVFATVEGRTASATVNVRQVAVTSVTVAPSSSSLAVGGAVQLVPTVLAGTTVLTNRVVGWTSSSDAIAVVSSTGRVTGLKAGVVTITATSEGVSGTATIIVGITSVVITPNPTSVTVGQTRQLTAVARDASNVAVPGVAFVWASANTATATVDASGVVTGRAAGTVSISASIGAVSGSVPVTVIR
jgi:trimeric autotransporter adhesin